MSVGPTPFFVRATWPGMTPGVASTTNAQYIGWKDHSTSINSFSISFLLFFIEAIPNPQVSLLSHQVTRQRKACETSCLDSIERTIFHFSFFFFFNFFFLRLFAFSRAHHGSFANPEIFSVSSQLIPARKNTGGRRPPTRVFGTLARTSLFVFSFFLSPEWNLFERFISAFFDKEFLPQSLLQHSYNRWGISF